MLKLNLLKLIVCFCLPGIFALNAHAETIWQISSKPASFNELNIQSDNFGYFSNEELQLGDLPEFNFTVVKTKDMTLVPDELGIIELNHPGWDLILRPSGRFDTDALGQGQLVDSIPVTLMENQQNCLHYGKISIPSLAQIKEVNGKQRVVMRNEDFTSEVKATLEIDGGNCYYLKFTGTAELSLTISQSVRDPKSAVTSAAASLPVKPIESVGEDFEGINPAIFRQAGTFKSEDLTAYGAVINGTHYISRCQGRANCDTLPLPSYSLAKSIVGGLGLMRLEKLYPGVKDELLSDYVESCSTWEGVTFSHLLDMTSGHYRSSRPHVDEDRYFWSFTTHPTAAEMTDYACSFPKEDKPGDTWVYRTSDTWLLGVAMQTFWQQKNGQNADFYADVLVPIWQELGLSELVMDSLRQDGQFYSGWGLVLRRNDIAKIALAIAQRQKTFMELFDSTMFDQATQFNGGPEGAQAGANTLKYSKGFWAWNAGRYLGCNRPVWVPTMSGFGGISVVMLPTGDVFYYFSDSGNYRYAEPVAELNKINSICRASS